MTLARCRNVNFGVWGNERARGAFGSGFFDLAFIRGHGVGAFTTLHIGGSAFTDVVEVRRGVRSDSRAVVGGVRGGSGGIIKRGERSHITEGSRGSGEVVERSGRRKYPLSDLILYAVA